MATAIESIIQCLEDVFRNKGLEPPAMSGDTELTTALGLDSLDYAELVVRLEGAFGYDPFANGVATDIRTVNDMAALYASSSPMPETSG